MKKIFRLSVLTLAACASGAYAQATAPVAAAVTSGAASAPVAISGQPNTFEREVTPLLREISRAKSKLELRRVQREIQKLDEEEQKSQLERDALAMPKAMPAPSGAGVSYNPFQAPTQSGAIPSLPDALAASALSTAPSVRVLMIYGFDNELHAKIAAGQQGGYVVKKGDVLPDGRTVADVKPNFVEVLRGGKGKQEVDRIFISATPEPATANGQGGPNGGGNASSVNNGINNMMAPIPAMPPQGMTSALPFKSLSK